MKRREFQQGLVATGLLWLTQPAWAAKTLSWKMVQELRHPSDINVEQIELSPDGQCVAAWASDGSLSLWNIAKQQKLWSRTEKTTLVTTSRTHMLCVDDGQIRQVALANGADNVSQAGVDPVAISPSGEWWAGLRERSTIMLWNSKTMKLVPLTSPPFVLRPEPRLYQFSEEGKWFVATQGVRCILWEISKPEDPIVLNDQPGEVTNVRLTREARWVIAGSMGGSLDIYNRLAPKQSQRAAYGGDIRSLGLDLPNNRVLVGCSEGPTPLAIQTLPNLKKPSAIPADPIRLGPCGDTWACSLRDKVAATGHSQGLIKIWKWS